MAVSLWYIHIYLLRLLYRLCPSFIYHTQELLLWSTWRIRAALM